MERIVGIIGAMETEVAYLQSVLTDRTEKDGFVSGRINGTRVVVVRSGVGKVNAALAAARLIWQYGVDCIMNTGIAGCTREGLDVLDFVVSADAVQHDVDVTVFGYRPMEIPGMGSPFFEASAELADLAISTFEAASGTEPFAGHRIVKGRIASGDRFISDNDVKARIVSECHPACVEMEGAAIAQVCCLNAVPFVVIRCMSDTADSSVPSSYDFNEDIAAEMSARLVEAMVRRM